MHPKPSSRLRPLSSLLFTLAVGCGGAPEEQERPEPLATESQALKGASRALPPGLSPSLVKDIQVGGDTTRSSAQKSGWRSYPAPVSTGSVVYFTAQEESTGIELWRTDGTPEGTRLVRDVMPGPDASASYRDLVAVGDTVYFIVSDPTSETLWKSDGTAEGTVQVRTSLGSTLRANDLAACNGQVFFHTADGVRSILWKSDGTPEGTVPLTSALTFGYRNPFYYPSQRICVDGTLFFVGTAGGYSGELWKTDGTVSGTVRLQSVGSLGWYGGVFTAVGSRVFLNTLSYSGQSLWTSDGTPVGTRPLTNIGFQPPSTMASVGGKLFFSLFNWQRGTSLWTSDGTEEGTRKYLDMGVTYPPASPFTFSFAGDTVLLSTSGRLYKSDGTAEGTVLVNDLSLATGDKPVSAVLPDGRLIFSALRNDGARPWVSDGTGSGTFELREARGQRLLSPGNFLSLGDRVVFSANDGVRGMEPWVTDGTPAGTRLLRDTFRDDSSLPRNLTDVEGTLFFTAFDSAHGRELWKTDGTAEGTALIKEFGLYPHQEPQKLTRVGNTLFFFTPFSSLTLWKSDGTPEGTVVVRDLRNSSLSYATVSTAVVGSTFFFAATTPGVGNELWKSDGTAQGTVLVKDITPGTSFSLPGPEQLTVFGDQLFFVANNGVHGSELWKTDGTAQGTLLVKDVRPGSGSSMDYMSLRQLRVVGNTLFFTANDGVHGEELWKTDGTAEGTVLVKDVHPGSTTSNPYDLVELEGALYFTAEDGVHGRELWKSDGTAEGTVLVADLRPGTGSSFPTIYMYPRRSSLLYGTDSGLYLVADDGVHGMEPWKSDGTAAGTFLLRDVLPGHLGSGVELSGFVPVGPHGGVAFTASNAVNGLELWMTDGTPAGTRVLADVAEGAMSASPALLTVSGPRLFFAADEGVHGRELWSVKHTAFKRR